MYNFVTVNESLQKQALEAIRKTQESALTVVQNWTAAVEKVTAYSPRIDVATAFPTFANYSKQFPSPSEAVDTSFEFVQKLLTNQRDFSRRLIAASAIRSAKTVVSQPKETPRAATPKPTTAKRSALPAVSETPAKPAAEVKPAAPKAATAVKVTAPKPAAAPAMPTAPKPADAKTTVVDAG